MMIDRQERGEKLLGLFFTNEPFSEICFFRTSSSVVALVNLGVVRTMQ